MTRPLVSILVLGVQTLLAQVHPNAHAHNDYEHDRPLLDALHNGFTSVEADVHLIGGKLYVSHNRPKPSAAITLEALYLKPLDSIGRLRGSIYEGHDEPLTLLVDIKTNATTTMKKLMEEIQQHPSLFPPGNPQRLVRVVISGNRDYGILMNTDLFLIDGRPDDLGKGIPSARMPLISDHFGNWMHWTGKGKPDEADLQRLKNLADRVHGEKKKLRLWGIPDREESWQVLLDAGVDLINTDRLEALNQFLTRNGK